MYPNLTPTLAVLLGVAVAISVYIGLRRPFLRKLAVPVCTATRPPRSPAPARTGRPSRR